MQMLLRRAQNDLDLDEDDAPARTDLELERNMLILRWCMKQYVAEEIDDLLLRAQSTGVVDAGADPGSVIGEPRAAPVKSAAREYLCATPCVPGAS